MIDPYAERFARAESTRIEAGGESLYSVVELDLRGPVTLVCERVRCRTDRPQGLVIDGGDTELTVGMVDATRITLWSDTAPVKVAVGIREHGPVRLRLWNTWRESGVEHAWVGWAAIKPYDTAETTTLSCSDGHEDGGFDDLVVALHRGPDHDSGALTTALQ